MDGEKDFADSRKWNPKLTVGKAENQPDSQHRILKDSGSGGGGNQDNDDWSKVLLEVVRHLSLPQFQQPETTAPPPQRKTGGIFSVFEGGWQASGGQAEVP